MPVISITGKSNVTGTLPQDSNTGEHIVMLCGANWHVSGGGQRPVGLAVAWCAMGFRVTYVERWKRVNEVARPVPPGIRVIKVSEIQHLPECTLLYTSFPAPDYNRLVVEARRRGIPVHYDVYDDWESMLAEQHISWFDPSWEDELIQQATSLSCVSATLQSKILQKWDRYASLNPNATDWNYFYPAYVAPKSNVILYVGALGRPWEWVHHKAIASIGSAFPGWEVRVIGGELLCDAPSNVKVLGQVAYSDLVDLVKGARIGIVPFRPCRSAYFCDPIKAWEYLSIGACVVVSNVPAWEDKPNTIHVSGETDDETEHNLIEAVRQAVNMPYRELGIVFKSQHDWYRRAEHILEIALHHSQR